jgi:hypothetical protein
MTKLLDKAIAKARQLPEEDQDAVALAMLAMADASPIVALDVATVRPTGRNLTAQDFGQSL